MIRYAFKDRPIVVNNADKLDAQTIGEALDDIRKATGGINPEDVEKAARVQSHPLHPHFEWDNKKAAYAHRLSQARSLITSISSVEAEGDKEVSRPAYVSISDKGGRSYRHITEVMTNSRLQALALEQAKRDLEAFRKRYQQFASLFEPGLSEIIDKFSEKKDDRAA